MQPGAQVSVRAIASIGFTLALCTRAVSAQDVWARADSAIVRLAPDRFPILPAPVRADLARRGCRIPQPNYSTRPSEPRNVVRGAFKAAGRADWAVLCSIRDTSVILVYPEGAATASDSLHSTPDRNYLQGMEGDRIAYSHGISAAPDSLIRRYARSYGGPTPPLVLDHDGINDGFLGKASVVYYFFEGKWLRLTGAD